MRMNMPENRILRILLRLVIIVVVLFALRLVVGIGSAWIHYSRTPNFTTYITEHPVSAETVSKSFSESALLSSNQAFFAGAIDPASLSSEQDGYERATRTAEMILHWGDEQLLRFSQSFHQTLDQEWVRHGLRIDPPKIHSHPDMRVVAETRVFGLDEMFDTEQPGQGGVVLDVVLAAGSGENQFRITGGEAHNVVKLDSPEYGLGQLMGGSGKGLSFPWWRAATGITHNLKRLPEEGLIHHFQLVVRFDRVKTENGSSGPSTHFPKHAVSTPEYSYAWSVSQGAGPDDTSGGSSETKQSMIRRWNGTI